jgi:hypothetical protein
MLSQTLDPLRFSHRSPHVLFVEELWVRHDVGHLVQEQVVVTANKRFSPMFFFWCGIPEKGRRREGRSRRRRRRRRRRRLEGEGG